MDLALVWYIVLGVLLTGYAILDGFDIGVGALHLFARGDTERRILMNSIGPVWDGNEVWLITFGGALFGVFPNAYATAFSGFYLAFVVLLFCLIFRAVAMEFRSKEPWAWWRKTWDVLFWIVNLLMPVLFGVTVGNMITGVALDKEGEITGGLLGLLKPYPILVGVFTLVTFFMHGSLYLYLKTDGDLQSRVRKWFWKAFFAFLFFYLLTTGVTLAYVPTAITNFKYAPWAWIVVVLDVFAIANVPRAVYLNRPIRAFVTSCCVIAAKVFLFGIAIFPNLIVSDINSAYNVTIYNAASSQMTLQIMLLMAVLGMPFVLAYSASIYWIFRGKVNIGQFSY